MSTSPPAVEVTAPPVSREVARVRILYSSESLLFSVENHPVAPGDNVVVPTRYGPEVGRVLGWVEDPETLRGAEVSPLTRVATDDDLERYAADEVRGDEALSVCRQQMDTHGVDMHLVTAHYVLDGSKLLIFFTATERIDFRSLLRDLVASFHTRIELRQIGVRDETRMVGGTGVCGRVLCCNGMADKMPRVSVKMAKEQGLPVDAKRISGQCGRLLCCLSYEYDVYREARANLPKEGTAVHYEDQRFRVVEINILTKRIRIAGPMGQRLGVGFGDLEFDEQERRWQVRAL